MAEDKSGSDLDVFEGLAKKPRSVAPGLMPPPPSGAGARSAATRTLVGGLTVPLPPPPNGGPAAARGPTATPLPPPPPMQKPSTTPLPPPPSGQAGPAALRGPTATPLPPPPPSARKPPSTPLPPLPPKIQTALPVGGPPATLRGLPPVPPPNRVSAPPASGGLPPLPPPVSKPAGRGPTTPLPPPPTARSASATPLPPPPAPPPKTSVGSALGFSDPQATAAKKNAVDMDWDDDEESTHVYAKEGEGGAPPRPAAGAPPPSKLGAAAAMIASSGGSAKLGSTPLPPIAGPMPGMGPSGTMAIPGGALPPVPGATPFPGGPGMMPAALPHARPDEPTYVKPRPTAPSSSRTGLIVAGVLAAVLIPAIAIAVFLLVPRKGQLKIDIKSKTGSAIEKAEIFVDGVKKCDTAPCVVNDLPAGAKTIKVIGDDVGAPQVVTESVEAGKERLVLITVDGAGAELKVSSVAPNVKLSIDGADKGTLPVDLKDVTPGSHKVKFDAGDRYEKLEQTLDMPSTGVKDLGSVKLKVLKGQVTVEVETKGANVALVREKDNKKTKVPEGDGTIKLDLDPNESWKLVATKKGFQDFTQEVTFADGVAEKTVKVALTEEGKEPPPAPVSAPAAPAPATHSAPSAPAAAAQDTKSSAPSGQGTLNMNSIPVSKVVLDGKPLGSTPKVGVSVPAGSHTVVFIHPDLGKKSVSVVVKPGETKTAAVKFDKGGGGE